MDKFETTTHGATAGPNICAAQLHAASSAKKGAAPQKKPSRNFNCAKEAYDMKTERIEFLATPALKAKLHQEAAMACISVSELIRQKVESSEDEKELKKQTAVLKKATAQARSAIEKAWESTLLRVSKEHRRIQPSSCLPVLVKPAQSIKRSHAQPDLQRVECDEVWSFVDMKQ